MVRIHTLLTLLLLALSLRAADTRQGIFAPSFQTLQVGLEGYTISVPILDMASDDRIVISFDQLAEDRQYLRYELIHCDRRWQPSGLVESEFLDGFNLADVDDYDFSRNTLVHYVHYRIAIPNEQMRPLISGNYLVRVFPEDDPDRTILQARFSINEGSMGVNARVTSRTDIDYNGEHQQVEVEVDTRLTDVDDRYSDVTLTIEQNGRQDNIATIDHPLRVAGKKLIYEHLPEMIFAAGNEYRRMETVSTTYPGMGVDHIEWHDPLYHFVLATDVPRYNLPYIYDQTQNGRFVVREYNSTESDTEADYAPVHFTLRTSAPLTGGDVYLDGDMTNRRFDTRWRMEYDPADGAYHLTALLKQGAYNYQYLVLPHGSDRAFTSIEGDFYPTVNEYIVRAYHRPRGARYDRLVGVTVIKNMY